MRPLSRTARHAARFGLCLTLACRDRLTASIVRRTGVAFARGAPDSFADLAAKLLPAVVNVSSTQSRADAEGPAGGPQAGPDIPMFPPGSPFEQFFKDFLNRGHPGQHGEGRGPSSGHKAWDRGSSSTHPAWS